MSKHLVHRLARLEQRAQARDLPAWDAMRAAEERLRTSARDRLEALLSDDDPPARDETQAQADAALLARWCAAYGVPMHWEYAREKVKARLARMAARHEAENTFCIERTHDASHYP